MRTAIAPTQRRYAQMTQKKVQGYLELSEKATPGPWQSERSHIYGADPERKLVCQVLYGRGNMDGATRDLILAARNDGPDIAKALAWAMQWLREDTSRNHPAHCICLRCETVRNYFKDDDNAG